MIYLLKTKNTRLIKQSIKTFKSIEEIEIKPLKIDLIKLSDFFWKESGMRIVDGESLRRMAKDIIEIIK